MSTPKFKVGDKVKITNDKALLSQIHVSKDLAGAEGLITYVNLTGCFNIYKGITYTVHTNPGSYSYPEPYLTSLDSKSNMSNTFEIGDRVEISTDQEKLKSSKVNASYLISFKGTIIEEGKVRWDKPDGTYWVKMDELNTRGNHTLYFYPEALTKIGNNSKISTNTIDKITEQLYDYVYHGREVDQANLLSEYKKLTGKERPAFMR